MKFIPASFMLTTDELEQLNSTYDLLSDIYNKCPSFTDDNDIEALKTDANSAMQLIKDIITNPIVAIEDE